LIGRVKLPPTLIGLHMSWTSFQSIFVKVV
jgi:hypothetical protein